jgi:hypothetical protein
MNHSFADLSQGELQVKLGEGPVRPVESRFGQSLRDRALQIQNRNSWKTQGTGARFMSGGALWGNRDSNPAEMRIAITGISSGCQNGELLYSLASDDIGGVFLWRNQRARSSAGSTPPTFASAAWPPAQDGIVSPACSNTKEEVPASP